MHSVNFFSPFITGLFSVFTIFIGVFLQEKKAKIFAIIFSVVAILVSFIPLTIELKLAAQLESPPTLLFIGWLYQILLAIISIASIIIIANDRRDDVSRFEIYPIISLSFAGMLFAIFSESILGIYLGLELISISGYIIAGINRRNAASNEATMKYFIIGAISSCMMIYGISLIYGFSGANFNINELAFTAIEENKVGLTIGFLMFAFGLFFKTTTFPFHFWAPDVYSGMNSSSLSFISIAPKIAAFCVLFKIVVFNLSHIPFGIYAFSNIAAFLSGASMVIGALGAIRQTSFKKILAYSGIAHMGFVFSIFSVSYDMTIASGVVYYFLIYTFINIGIFAVISCLCRNPFYKGDIGDLKGLYKSNPMLAFTLAVLMFSSAGIPPLAGFFIKYLILSILIGNGSFILPVIMVLSSVVSSFYYLRIIKTIYFDEQKLDFSHHSSNKINFFIKLLIFASLFVNLTFIYV